MKTFPFSKKRQLGRNFQFIFFLLGAEKKATRKGSAEWKGSLHALPGEVHLTASCAVRRPVSCCPLRGFAFFTEYYNTGPRKDEAAQEVHNTEYTYAKNPVCLSAGVCLACGETWWLAAAFSSVHIGRAGLAGRLQRKYLHQCL